MTVGYKKTAHLKRYICTSSVLLITWLCIIPSFAQQYLFEAQHITTDDGLANLMTFSILKNRQRFTWISNQHGLNLYNGYSFKHYTKEKNGLSSNGDIREIREDEDGNLWLFHSKEINILSKDYFVYAIDIFNTISEEVMPFEEYFSGSAPFISADVHIPQIIDPNNRIWITTTNGIIFLYENGEFKKIIENKDTPVKYITIDMEDNIWVGWEKSATLINKSGEILETITVPDQIYGIWTDENNTAWLANKKKEEESEIAEITIWYKKKESDELKLLTFFRDKKQVEIISKKNYYVHRDQKGYWYCSFNQQTYIFDSSGKFIFDFQEVLGEGFGLVFLNHFESEDYLWWATPTGVLKTSLKKNPFQLVHNMENSFSDCRGITEDKIGNIYFLNNSILQWNPKEDKLKSITLETNAYALAYKDSLLWTGTYYGDKLGFQFDLKTNEIIEYLSINADLAFDLLESEIPGKYLAGTDQGLEYVDLNLHKILPFRKYRPNAPTDDLLKNSQVYHLHRNKTGIWLATNNGVFLVDENQGVLEHFSTPKYPLFKDVRHIYEDKEGFFWLATGGEGIIRWKPGVSSQSSKNGDSAQQNNIKQFTAADGLSHNYTYAIYEDDYNKLWMPSDKGLMCMDKSTFQIITYLKEDGLPHNEFNLRPFSPQELVLRIQKLIEIRQLLQHRYQNAGQLEKVDEYQQEDEFVLNLREFILQNIEETNLNGELIGKHFNMSRLHLHRKLKALVNQPISEFVQINRLKRAMELIQDGKLNVSEISYKTGFPSISHFSRTFKKVYGKSPSEM